MAAFKYKQSAKFRVIVKGVSVYTTAKQIRWSLGDMAAVNNAVSAALASLENMKSDSNMAVGLVGRWHDMEVQLSEIDFA